MKKYKYVILGGGPAGLSLACRLLACGEKSVILIEKEYEAGGLCRSAIVDDSAFDIGGGHFLDVRRPDVLEFLFSYMPLKEWNIFTRDSRININGYEISHPIEANIWQFPEEIQKQYIESVKAAGCNTGKTIPSKFVDWITWKLGDKIANDYMLPYNMKMFSNDLDDLGIYWLDKLPDVSYEDIINSINEHKAYAKQPGHAEFYYPKEGGYGELWNRMATSISDHIEYNVSAVRMNLYNKSVELDDGRNISGEYIINTIPWNCFDVIEGLSDEAFRGIKKLKSSAIETRYVPETLETDAQWIYEPESKIPYHRILVRSNFCTQSRGYWLETRKERVSMYKGTEYENNMSFINEYAYPLNTVDKPEIMSRLIQECESHKVIGLGRWGEHSHFNSDLVVKKALSLAEKIKG